MTSIKELIKKNLDIEGDINPEEFATLILDDQKLARSLTKDDQAYLEKFTEVELLALNETDLKSLDNLPALPSLKRIELQANGLAGAELKKLLAYKESLHTLKFQENKVADFAELEAIKELALCNISLEGNPIAEKDGYRERVFEIFSFLESLDGKNKEGEEVDSIDGSEDYGEEGEAEIDEETMKKLREQGFALAEDGEDDLDDEEYGEDMFGGDDEDGEDEGDDDESEEEEEPAKKRRK